MSLDIDPPRSRAVLLGVSFFPRDPERLPPLPAVCNNLRDLERALADPTILGLDPRHITVVDDRPSSEMLSKLVEVADEAEDTLIVYYGGHGVPGSASLYLTGTDSRERTIEFDGMPFDQLRRALNTSPARKKVLILDCCYSGRAIEVMGTADAMLQAGIDAIEGTYTLASSGATEASAAPAGARHTAFTGEFLRILHEGVENAPQTLKLSEIFRALRLALRRNPKLPEPRQAAKGTASDIDLVYNRAWRPENKAREPERTAEGAPATEPTPEWRKELADRIERQSRLLEALQKQLAAREAAAAERMQQSGKGCELAEDQAAFDRSAATAHEASENAEAHRKLLMKQEARIAELEASLARTAQHHSGVLRPTAKGAWRPLLPSILAITLAILAETYSHKLVPGTHLYVFIYPIMFLVINLANHRLGPRNARTVAYVGFGVYMALQKFLYSLLPLEFVFLNSAAFITSMLLSIAILDRMRQKRWWQAPLVSSAIALAWFFLISRIILIYNMFYIGSLIFFDFLPWLLALGLMPPLLLIPYRALMGGSIIARMLPRRGETDV
jgi:uncharacterized PurR-regulated membrane protein YhhQ (DUF165 family)